MQPNDIADLLETAGAQENGGRGIKTVRTMVKYLRLGEAELAKYVHHWDGDKTRAYPKIEKLIQDLLGCREHHVVKCRDSLCAYFNTYLQEQL